MAQKDFLYSRLEDAAEKAVRWDQAVYGDFYEENLQHGIEREIGRYPEADCAFFGGQEYSRRKMLSVFPKGDVPGIQAYPLDLIFISVRGDVSHRDYLGALLGLGDAAVLCDSGVDQGHIALVRLRSLLCQGGCAARRRRP